MKSCVKNKMPKRGYTSGTSYNARYKRARTQGRAYKGTVAVLTRGAGKKRMSTRVNKLVISKVNNLYRMIETKECTWSLESTRSPLVQNFMSHNNVTLWSQNPFQISQGAADQMQTGNQVNRIGDRITVKGMMCKGFFENALSRPKVFYRVMLIRCAKGDTIDRGTLFKGNCANKMIDQVNTERFTIVAQKQFTIDSSNTVTTNVDASGQPYADGRSGIGTRTFKMWIPGSKFGNNGNIQYENGSYQLKFFDYRFVFVAYDWFGTPQDVNNVGLINTFYTKVYFKDA